MVETVVQSQSNLLAYALFDLDPRARCLRQPLLVFLVSLALFERGRPADREELLVACTDLFLNDDEIDRGQIDRVVAACIGAGLLVDVGEGSIDLSEERREQLNEAAKRIDAQREAFHRAIRLSVESELGEEISPESRQGLEVALDDFIQRLFQEQSVALAQVFGPNGNGFDDAAAGHLTVKSLDTLARAVVPTSEKLERAQVAQGIRAGLLDLSPDGQKYLAAVYQRTVAFALLQQDPSVRKIKRDLAKERQFYLDTNVVMALLFSAHIQHERVLLAVNAARDVGCEIVISTFTLEELERQLKESDETYRKLKSQKKAFSIVNDDILRTFALKQAETPGIRWRAFHATYFPPKEALANFGIEIRNDEFAEAHHDNRRADVRMSVQSVKPFNTHPKVIDYDTDNLILIQRRRKQLHADAMGSRVWLVTLDTALKSAERRLIERGVYAVPSAKRIGAWVADLSPHLSPDDADLAEYALHLVQSQLGLLAEDPVFADVNFLTTLQESPFDVKELLAADPEMSRRIIVALQEEQEIKAVLGERPEDEADYPEWAERFAEAVKVALEKLDRSTVTEEEATVAKRERDRALLREVSAKRERDRTLRRVSQLENELDRRARGFGRLLGRFRDLLSRSSR
jgi:hypothetical protein